MDVAANRDIDTVIILGSGMSILDLKEEEKAYINRCKTVIALNKFMAFYEKSALLPTHVYFVDTHENSLLFLQYIFDFCKKKKLKNISFILNKNIKKDFSLYSIQKKIKRLRNKARVFFWQFLLPKEQLEGLRNTMYLQGSAHNKYEFISTKTWMEDCPWASSLEEPLFHYRGSLTTALNYCSITKPKQDIYLVGNDFYGSEYFFEKELSLLSIDASDWTTPLVKANKVHFSFQDYKGTKMPDKIAFILQKLKQSGINLYSINKNSLLVSDCNVPFKKLPN